MTTREFLDAGVQGVALLDHVTLHDWQPVFPGATEQPEGGFLFAVEERIPCTLESGAVAHLLVLRYIRPHDGSISFNPAHLAYRWEAPHA